MQVKGGGCGEGGEKLLPTLFIQYIWGNIRNSTIYNYKFILKTAVTDGSLSPKTFISI